MRLSIFISGHPATKGSPHIGRRKDGRAFLAPDSRALEIWDKVVEGEALKARPTIPFVGPLSAGMIFRLRRPLAHYKSDGTVKAGAPRAPAGRPDLSKLVRAVEDPLVRGRWMLDDAQIVRFHELAKEYTERPDQAEGVWVEIRTLSNQEGEDDDSGRADDGQDHAADRG